MNNTLQILFPGQRVITSAGNVATIAYVQASQVWAWVFGKLTLVKVKADAWGGEHDQTLMNAA